MAIISRVASIVCAVILAHTLEKAQSADIELTNQCKIWGDPHFHTWYGSIYNFQGTGYFDYLKECNRGDGWDLPLVISGKQDICGSDVTCISEIIIQIKHINEDDDSIIEMNYISYAEGGTNPIYKNYGSSAIGTHTYKGEHGEIIFNVEENYFEITFITGNGETGMVSLNFYDKTLILNTNDALSGLICGLCGTLNDGNNDYYFTKCTDNENIEFIDTNINEFGATCCRKDLDLRHIGTSECDPWNSPSVSTVPKIPDSECLDIAENICISTYNEFCTNECLDVNSEPNDEYLIGCSYDICSVSECKNYIDNLENENDFNIETLYEMECLKTSINFCETDCKNTKEIEPTSTDSDICNNREKYGETKKLYRWYNSGVYDHFFTTSTNEPANTNSWKYEGVAGYLWKNEIDGVTFPLYRYYSSSVFDHFYTTNWNELENGNGIYKYEGIQGYVMKKQCDDFNKPFYRYYSSSVFDHHYTSSWNELGTGNSAYKLEGIQGYIATF